MLIFEANRDNMRLTVYLTDAPVKRTEVMTKDGPVFKKILHNTLSFAGINKEDVSGILSSITEKQGKVVSHTLSPDKTTGHARVKRKK
jgi:hypothetical protein